MAPKSPARQHTKLQVNEGLHGVLTAVSYTPKAGLSFVKWTEAGASLGQMSRSMAFWLGDWILYGEGAYGEKFSASLEATGRDEKTLLEYQRVCKAVAKERRREELSFAHHESVSALDPESQTFWLSRAIEGDKLPSGETEMWSTRRLRAELKKEGHDVPEPVVEVEVEDKAVLVAAVQEGKVPVEVLTVDIKAVRDLYKRGTHEIPGLKLTAPGSEPETVPADPDALAEP